MSNSSEDPLDRLWTEYGDAFKGFDDLTLARWISQTLGQLEGKVWRLSHPLIGALRLAGVQGHKREIWHKRLVSIPSAYTEAPCCRAPLLGFFTRYIVETGLICPFCSETAVALEEIPNPLRSRIQNWAEDYGRIHEVAHWSEAGMDQSDDYDEDLELAAEQSEKSLADLGRVLAPRLLEFFPAIIWEDQDNCLEVRPEDIQFEP